MPGNKAPKTFNSNAIDSKLAKPAKQLSDKDMKILSGNIKIMLLNTQKYYNTLVNSDNQKTFPKFVDRFVIYLIEARKGLYNKNSSGMFSYYDPNLESKLYKQNYNHDDDRWIGYLDGMQDILLFIKGKEYPDDVIKHHQDLHNYTCETLQNSYIIWMYLVMLYLNFSEEKIINGKKLKILKSNYFVNFYNDWKDNYDAFNPIVESFVYADRSALSAVNFDIENDPPLVSNNSNEIVIVGNNKPSYAKVLLDQMCDNNDSITIPQDDDIMLILENINELVNENSNLKTENDELRAKIELLTTENSKLKNENSELKETNKTLSTKINIYTVAFKGLKKN
jgi:regulator of replication initiation timing